MQQKANAKLSKYLAKQPIEFETYIDVTTEPGVTCINYDVVPRIHATPIIRSNGQPFAPVLGKRRRHKPAGDVQPELLKLRPYRRSYRQQLEHSYALLDENFAILEAHLLFSKNPNRYPRPQRPSFEVECRSSAKFECGNWSRYPNIWMIYLAALKPEAFCDTDHLIDLDITSTARSFKRPADALLALNRYRARVYSIIHGGNFFYLNLLTFFMTFFCRL